MACSQDKRDQPIEPQNVTEVPKTVPAKPALNAAQQVETNVSVKIDMVDDAQVGNLVISTP